jgi:TonB-linked SusC/RagA family outer membrane protein
MKIHMQFLKKITLLPFLFFYSGVVISAQQDPASDEKKAETETVVPEEQFKIPFLTSSTRSTTAPVEIISGDELQRLPGSDLEEMLTGKIAGGEFVSVSNRPGSDKTRLRIRGFTYLVLVDGVPRPIDEISPYEVERINILRGLSATSMYGPDARDGIIYIETRRGAEGEKLINVDIEYGMSAVNERFLPEWIGAYDYANLYNEAARNDEIPELYSADELSLYESGEAPLRYPDEDLYSQVFNNSMSFRRANMNFGGGDDITRYFINLNYLGEGDGLYKINSLTYDGIGLRSNLDIKVTEFLKFNVGAYGKYDLLKAPNTEDDSWQLIAGNTQYSIWPVLRSYPPNAYPVTIAPDTFGTNVAFPINPVGDLTNQMQTTSHRRTGRININMDFDFSKWLPGLKASSMLAYDIYSESAFSERPDRTYALYEPLFFDDGDNLPDSLRQYGLNDASAGIRQVFDYYTTNFYNFSKLCYQNNFGKHLVNTALINSLSTFSYKLPNASRQDEKKQNLSYTLFYSFDNRYCIDLILSYSGIMNLPSESRFELFPTVGAGWIISEESFMADIKSVNLLKVRGSYGKMGYFNSNSLFLYRTFWDQGSWVNFNNRAENISGRYRGTVLSQMGNSNIGWGAQTELNVGMDAVLLNSLFLSVDYYDILREGLIMNSPVPTILGTDTYMENIGVNNYSGIDMSVNYTYQQSDKISISIGLRGGYATSEVISSNEVEYPFPWIGTVGNPTDAIYGLVADGLLTEADLEGTNQLFGPVSEGNIKYLDLNEDDVVQEFIDEKLIGNSRPRYNYGLDVHIIYRNFSLYVLGYGLADYDVNIRNNNYFYGYGNNKYSAYLMENRWVPESPDAGARHPRLTTGTNNNDNRNSTYWLVDGSFFKIKNVEFAYLFDNLPVNQVKGFKLFLRGTNLITFSNLKDLDPENIGFGVNTYPSMRTFTTGLSLSF